MCALREFLDDMNAHKERDAETRARGQREYEHTNMQMEDVERDEEAPARDREALLDNCMV